MTEDQAQAGLLPVTQADRDAARRHFQLNPTDFFDQERLTRAFARHRLQSLEQPKPSGESAGEVRVIVRAARCGHHFDQDCSSCRNAEQWTNQQLDELRTALSERGAVGEEVAIPRALFDFLMGCGEIDGSSFSDLHESLPGRFWWRALLRTCDRAALSSIQGAGANSSGLADTPAEKG